MERNFRDTTRNQPARRPRSSARAAPRQWPRPKCSARLWPRQSRRRADSCLRLWVETPYSTPSEHPIQSPLESTKMGGEFTCPKMVPLVLTSSVSLSVGRFVFLLRNGVTSTSNWWCPLRGPPGLIPTVPEHKQVQLAVYGQPFCPGK